MRRKPYWVISALLIIVVLAVLVTVMGNNAPTTYIQEAVSTTVAIAMPIATNMPDSSTPVPAVSDITAYQIVVPPTYQEAGTVPVYRAIECDLTGIVQPEWFNQSGTAEERSETSVVFTDHATLSYGADYLDYLQYSSEMYDCNAAERERTGRDISPYMMRVPAMSDFIVDIAGCVHSGYPFAQNVGLDRDHLTYISLAEAQQIAEDMLGKLGLHGYTCSYALDMSVERIHMLGDGYNQYWYEGNACNNKPRMDYSQVTADDEGYYLIYTLMGDDSTNEAPTDFTLFVNRGGIAYASLRNAYNLGEPLYTPETLLSPDQAISVLKAEAVASWTHKPVQTVRKVSLVYRAINSEADGKVFVPVWRIEYKDADSASRNYDCWGEINAVTGKLVNAIFKESR